MTLTRTRQATKKCNDGTQYVGTCWKNYYWNGGNTKVRHDKNYAHNVNENRVEVVVCQLDRISETHHALRRINYRRIQITLTVDEI